MNNLNLSIDNCYIIFYSFLFSVIFLTFHNKISKIIGIYDEVDNKRKIHKKRVPITGGIYFFLSLLILVLFRENSENFSIVDLFSNHFNFYFFGLPLFLIFMLGLVDDKKDISANSKLLFSIFIIFIATIIDSQLLISELRFNSLELELNIFSYRFLFTILCFLLFLNACNMFDGIDGQSSLYFIFLLVYIQFIIGFSLFLFLLSMILCCFLYLNLNSKSYLGDGGVYLISFLLSCIIIKNYNLNNFYCDQIFLLMFIPGIDLLRLAMQRIIKKRHPFSPDNLHLHHLLLRRFSKAKTVFIIFLLISIPNILAVILNDYLFFLGLSFVIYTFIIFLNLKINHK